MFFIYTTYQQSRVNVMTTTRVSFLSFMVLLVSWIVPPFVSAATSYTELRGLAGSDGQTATIVADRIGGTFVFSLSDPVGDGDDGGIIIKAPNGWWVRSFSHTRTEPIALDWYQVTDGQNITPIVIRLANQYQPRLYLKAPKMSVTLLMDPIDFGTLGITYFAFLESNAMVYIQQTGTNTLFWRFQNMNELVIGSDVKKANRDSYNLTLVGNWTSEGRTLTGGDALVKIDGQDIIAPPFYFRFNTKYPKHQSIRMYGGGGPQVSYVSGRFEGGGMTFGTRKGAIVFENAYVSDPLGAGHGWDGSLSGDVYKSLATVRVVGVTVVSSEKVTGSLNLQYGGVAFFSLFCNDIGNGPDDPLVVYSEDYGYSGPNDRGYASGIRLKTPWFMTLGVKFDGMGIEQANHRWIKVVQRDNYGSANSIRRIFLEASQCDDVPNCSATSDSYTTWTLVNISGAVNTNGTGTHPDDRIHHMIYQGDGVQPAMLAGVLNLGLRDIAQNGQFYTLDIVPWANPLAHPTAEDGAHNTIRNVSLTGKITVRYYKAPGNDNHVENATWLGSAREVMRIDAGTSVIATNLCAPAGSTIGGDGSLVLDGRTIALPYTLQNSDCRSVVPNIPPRPITKGEIAAVGQLRIPLTP